MSENGSVIERETYTHMESSSSRPSSPSMIAASLAVGTGTRSMVSPGPKGSTTPTVEEAEEKDGAEDDDAVEGAEDGEAAAPASSSSRPSSPASSALSSSPFPSPFPSPGATVVVVVM